MKRKIFWLFFDIIVLGSVWGGSIAIVWLLVHSAPDGVAELRTNDKGELWPEVIYMSIMIVLAFCRMIYYSLNSFVGGKFWRKN